MDEAQYITVITDTRLLKSQPFVLQTTTLLNIQGCKQIQASKSACTGKVREMS